MGKSSSECGCKPQQLRDRPDGEFGAISYMRRYDQEARRWAWIERKVQMHMSLGA